MTTALDTKIYAYYHLKSQRDLIDGQLKKLNTEIKAAMLQDKERLHTGDHVTYEYEQFAADIVVKQGPRKVDDQHLLDLLATKGLTVSCTKLVPDHDAVEQAYINGDISDEDLRSIDQGSKVQLALSIDRRPDKLLIGEEVAEEGWA